VGSAVGRLSPFGRLWGAYAFSAIGSALSAFALQVLVIDHLHADQQQVGWLRAAQWAPYLAFGLLAGAIADRVRRKRVLVTFDLLNAGVLVIIAVLALTDALSLLTLAILVLLRGCFGLTYEAAHQSFVPDLVDPSNLTRAGARLEQSSMVAQTGGPAVAGVVLSWVGAPLLLGLDAITYLGSAILLSGIREEQADTERHAATTAVRTAIKEGLRYVYTHRLLRWYAGTLHLWFVGNALVSTLLVFYALRDLRLSAAVVGICLAIGGVAGVAGAGLSHRLSMRFGLGWMLLASHVVLPLAYVVLVLTRPGVWAAFLLGGVQVVVGFVLGVGSPMELSWRNTITRPELRGRMNGTIRSVNWGMNTISGPVAGAAAAAAGTRAAMVTGIVVLATVAVVFACSPMRSVRMPAQQPTPG
jgi:predicted MFS family arabinose efflux permease